jgi:hypothetical protein
MLREQQLVLRVFVVHAQDAALAACVDREEMDGVAVRAELALLQFRCARLEQDAAGKSRSVEVGNGGPQTVAPAHQQVVAITGRQQHRVRLAALNRLEGQLARRTRSRARAEQATAGDCKRR